MLALVFLSLLAIASAAVTSTSQLNGVSTRNVIGMPCASTVDCSSRLINSICIEGVCRCGAGYIAHNDRCKIRTNEECYQSNDPICYDEHASCVREMFTYPSGWVGPVFYCRCNANFTHDAVHDQCRPSLGSQCHQDVPCVAGECNAITNVCTCPGFLVPSSDGLSCLAGLGAICATTECADENAECINSVCQCQINFQSVLLSGGTFPVCRKRLGAQCIETSECAITNSECVDRLLLRPLNALQSNATACTCREGHVPTASLDSCLPVQGVVGRACTISSQCVPLGRHSVCNNDACACAVGHAYDWQDASCVRS